MKLIPAKLTTGAAIAIAASSVTAYTFAAPEYDRIKKDISVMIGIVKSSLSESEDCDNCSVRISGHYLADQGVVFNVDPTGSFHYRFKTVSDAVAPSVVAINGLVENIIEDVQIEFGDDGAHGWEFHTEDMVDDNLDAEREMREAKRELREIAREMRQLELEAIHARDEELESLKQRELELQEELTSAEETHNEVRERVTRLAQERSEARELRRTKRLAEKQQQFTQMEDIVLDAFCDYSSTMRNVPGGEKVSIIINKDEDESNIYVFEQSKLKDCDSRNANVREHALTYVF